MTSRTWPTRLLASLLLVAAAPLSAQTSVWKITSGDHTIYLGGTCHVLRPADYPLPPEFDAAFAAATTLYFETDIARIGEPATQQLLLARGLLPEGQSIESVLKPATWTAVQAYLRDSGVPTANFLRFKPWLLTVTITVIEMQKLGLSLQGVDHFYHRKAVQAGKPVQPLETFERHIDYVTNLGAGHEDEMVLNTVGEVKELPAVLDTLLNAWKAGDVEKLDQTMIADVRTKYPSIYRELFVERNNAWLPQLEQMLRTPAVEFVLVGAGHLAGDDGLLAALRRRGCRVEQLIVKK